VALSHITKVFAAKQARISALLTDPAGGVCTYSASIDVPGLKNVKVSGTVATVDLRGSNTYLDSDTVLQNIMVEIDYAKLSFDVLNVMLGGTITDTGTTPNQTTVWPLGNPPTFGYFKLEARAAAVDVPTGDLHIDFAKVKLADFPQLGLVEENYQTMNLKCKAVPPIGTSVWLTVTENETAAVIS
jgi:hypothetical protein